MHSRAARLIDVAQIGIEEWVFAYNHRRPHQPLDMPTPVSRFRPVPMPAATMPTSDRSQPAASVPASAQSSVSVQVTNRFRPARSPRRRRRARRA
ncbi:integrase core domain-containing protein [Streptomyces sp. NPDC001777]|uniref:integrase core domain-containing protein n=1 Tax=Streptomyces sp. NPDC001777 TaxID=3364608 RepID=UPI0036C46002